MGEIVWSDIMDDFVHKNTFVEKQSLANIQPFKLSEHVGDMSSVMTTEDNPHTSIL